MGDKLGWETSQEGGHSIPDQVRDKLGDKLRENRRQAGRHAQEAGHGILDQLEDKVGDQTGDKRKTSPGRRTQHPSQGGHIRMDIDEIQPCGKT